MTHSQTPTGDGVRRSLIALFLSLSASLILQPCPGSAAGNRGDPSASCIFDRLTLQTPPGLCRPRARAYPASVRGEVRHAIYDSALIYGIPYRILLKIAFCESSLNPLAVNGPHYGLFQFLPATFHWGARRMRRETGITAWTYWDVDDAAYVAGYLFATGYSRRWACERPFTY